MTKNILNKSLIDILTDTPEKYIFDALNNGIPSFFVRKIFIYIPFLKGIKNLYELYLNVFKNLTGVPLKNYGVFFNSE